MRLWDHVSGLIKVKMAFYVWTEDFFVLVIEEKNKTTILDSKNLKRKHRDLHL